MKKHKDILIDYTIFAIGYLWVFYSYRIAVINDTFVFFARSGSIIILASGFVELRFIIVQIGRMIKYTERKENLSSDRLFDALKVNVSDKVTRYVSYVSIFLGTIIWAYGDLILKYFITHNQVDCLKY